MEVLLEDISGKCDLLLEQIAVIQKELREMRRELPAKIDMDLLKRRLS